MKRHLALKSEYLAPLSAEELSSVAGAGTLVDCLTGYYPSLNAPCPTVQECLASIPSLQRACPTDYCTGTTSF